MTTQQPTPHPQAKKIENGIYCCPICDHTLDPVFSSGYCYRCKKEFPYTTHTSAGSPRRIEQVIKELEKRKARLDYPDCPPGDTYSEIIALLREGERE